MQRKVGEGLQIESYKFCKVKKFGLWNLSASKKEDDVEVASLPCLFVRHRSARLFWPRTDTRRLIWLLKEGEIVKF